MDWKSNIFRGETWLRAVFMLLYAVVYGIAEIVMLAVVGFQFLHTLITGKQNKQALDFGRSLSIFLYQVFAFLTYNSERKPFPFAPWPAANAPAPALPPPEQDA